jgi:hypothetical protein
VSWEIDKERKTYHASNLNKCEDKLCEVDKHCKVDNKPRLKRKLFQTGKSYARNIRKNVRNRSYVMKSTPNEANSEYEGRG